MKVTITLTRIRTILIVVRILVMIVVIVVPVIIAPSHRYSDCPHSLFVGDVLQGICRESELQDITSHHMCIVCIYIYIYTHIVHVYIYVYTHTIDSELQDAPPPIFGGTHMSKTACLTLVFFQRGETCSNLR